MNRPWICPRCNRVYAPAMLECYACNKNVEVLRDDSGVNVIAPKRLTTCIEAGKRGGAIGGHARAKALTPERRKQIASLAARTRWNREIAGVPIPRVDAYSTKKANGQ